MGVHLHHKKLAWVLAILLSLCTTLTSGISYKSHFSFIGTKINESSFSKALTIFPESTSCAHKHGRAGASPAIRRA